MYISRSFWFFGSRCCALCSSTIWLCYLHNNFFPMPFLPWSIVNGISDQWAFLGGTIKLSKWSTNHWLINSCSKNECISAPLESARCTIKSTTTTLVNLHSLTLLRLQYRLLPLPHPLQISNHFSPHPHQHFPLDPPSCSPANDS